MRPKSSCLRELIRIGNLSMAEVLCSIQKCLGGAPSFPKVSSGSHLNTHPLRPLRGRNRAGQTLSSQVLRIQESRPACMTSEPITRSDAVLWDVIRHGKTLGYRRLVAPSCYKPVYFAMLNMEQTDYIYVYKPWSRIMLVRHTRSFALCHVAALGPLFQRLCEMRHHRQSVQQRPNEIDSRLRARDIRSIR